MQQYRQQSPPFEAHPLAQDPPSTNSNNTSLLTSTDTQNPTQASPSAPQSRRASPPSSPSLPSGAVGQEKLAHVDARSLPPQNPYEKGHNSESESESEVDDDDDDDMARPPLLRPTDGRSQLPLLMDDDRGRPSYDGDPGDGQRRSFVRSRMRSRSPTTAAKLANRKKYMVAGAFFLLSLVSFTVQTETASYITHELKWEKPYCMLYLTHGSWAMLWPVQLLILRLRKRKTPWRVFWRQHAYIVRSTAQMVESHDLHPSGRDMQKSPLLYMLRMTAIVTTALTIAGGSWYVAVDLTTASDLTAIYNCSAFFAYAFSIPLLKDKIRFDKVFSVVVAIVGVLLVASGAPKTGSPHGGATHGDKAPEGDDPAKNRPLGNMIIGVGSVLYGLYEVLYKKLACPPEGTTPMRGVVFANTFGSLIGCFTLFVLWIPLPILHVLGYETFEVPRGEVAWMLCISVISNATFSGAFLVLISLTSPVLSSVAGLLTIFLVAVVDWFIGTTKLTPAAIAGGLLIISAFLLLSWSTYRELEEEKRRTLENDASDSDSDP